MSDHEYAPAFFCAQYEAMKLSLARQELSLRPCTLAFYWNAKGKTNSSRFIQEGQLVKTYE
ncbi:uncharacterized protein HMPREF1541_03510 [Cyphellophora europaea CBS 101466]|uniref:Uncharacterized protein n=1 Tax=Cyphellophora europaea (strain CBS 101466) TaxID=1220924 RepID=W2S0U5_CYPE1|nr:uncharacterized protein HMPREF1541_03510 [Cyphellophora europaea CBS 101466]ETN41574.1 hypothetical protein HMPREF1541_03510 [Cyphellophora europaea CBS 101466]